MSPRWYNVILVFFSMAFVSFDSYGLTDAALRKNIIKKISMTKSILRSKSSRAKKIKAVSNLKKYVKNKSAKKAGYEFMWIEGFKISLAIMSDANLKSKKCDKMRHELFREFNAKTTNPRKLPDYAQQTYVLIQSYCK